MKHLVSVLCTAVCILMYPVFLEASSKKEIHKVCMEDSDMKVFDESSIWGPIDASPSLKASVHKFADRLQVVADCEQACFTVKSKARARRKMQSTASKVFIGRKAAAYVSVEVVDSNGITVFADEAKDTSRLMGALVGDWNKEGPSKATDRLAKRMNQASRKWEACSVQ